ncbi:MAG TPA: ABC transporter permease [Pyrinomonadaceae bacterium]|nr:ABC transporter permease [Acidobacteriota bacterium]HQZ95068.1 ABC transporter permease [Pyrinomonadaceae bacterium]
MNIQSIKDTWLTVLDSIRNNKLRSGLTLTGVIVGTAVVALVGAVLTGLSQRVQEVSDKSSPNVIYFTKEPRIGPSLQQLTAEERQRKDFTLNDAIAVSELESPQAVSPQKVRGSYGPSADIPKVTARSREGINPLILGVWENYPQVINVPLENGRFFTEAERRARASVAVIGYGIAKQIFEEIDPVGEDVKIDGKLFRVVGVLGRSTGEGVIGSDELDERTVYIPFETSMKFYPEIEGTLIAVRAPNGKVDEVTDEVTYLLRKRRGLKSSDENNFGVNRSEQVFELVNDVINGLGVIVVPIALASLFVGGVGVTNIMFVSVKERTEEIGIRRALGATRNVILRQFLVEAIVLTSLGGLIGIAVGLILAFAVRTIISFPAAVPFWALAAGFGASVVVGLIAGIYPALQASRLDPVEAMRRV